MDTHTSCWSLFRPMSPPIMEPNQSHFNFSLDLPSLDGPSGADGGAHVGNISDSEPESTEVHLKEVTFIIYVPIFGTICLFGLLGNTLSFVVLEWEKRNKVATFLLQALAMADNLFLLISGFSQIFSAMCIYYGWDEVHDKALPYIRVFIWPLVFITQFGTVWMTVLIAANRYIAICRPFQAHKLCSMSKVRLQVGMVALLALTYNIPKFLEYRLTQEVDEVTNRTYTTAVETSVLQSRIYTLVYMNVMYCLFVFLGPLVMLVVLNVCLIRELVAARQRFLKRQIPIAGEEEENNITLVMVIIMAIFVITQTPAFINTLIDTLNRDAYNTITFFYYYHISNLLVCLNSSTNFVVYCLFRQQFRERIRNFCDKHKSRFLLKQTNSLRQNGTTISMYSNAATDRTKRDAI